MKKITIIAIIIWAIPASMFGQDILFSQPNEAPLLLNPANAGAQYNLRTTANYRLQWRSVTAPFRTIAAGVDGKVFSQGKTGSSIGAGLCLFNDAAGDGHLNTNQVIISASGKVTLTKNQTLSAGISGGIIQRKIAVSDLTWGNQYNGLTYDASLPSNESFSGESFLNGDFGTGIQWSYGKGQRTLSSNDMFGAQAGLSVSHVNSPRSGFYKAIDKRALKYAFHFTGSYGFKNTNMQVSPLLIYEMQGPARMIYIGSFLRYKLQESSKYTDYVLSRTVSLGGFFRGKDAAVIAAQCELGQIAFGLSYDINISSLAKVSSGRGGFEISLRYLPLNPSKSSRLL
jgi:type IX secretion system PorP/SprF family membrane protein